MKKLFLVISILTAPILGNSQNFVSDKYSFVGEPENGVYLVAVGGNTKSGILQGAKWGFVDNDGKEILAARYDLIGDFIEGFAIVKQGAKYGFINKDYKLVIPCQYTAVGSFNEKGLVWVNVGGKLSDDNPDIYTGGQFGVLNTAGEIVVPVKFKSIGTFVPELSEIANPFASFSTIPKHFKEMEKDAGSYDVHKYEYVETRMLSPLEMMIDGNIVVSNTGTHNFDGIYSEQGELLVPPGKFESIYNVSENMVPVSRFENGELQANYFKIEEQGLMFTNWVKVDCISTFKSARAIMAVHNKNTFIDNKGHKLGTPYKIIFPSTSGTYVVLNDEMMFGLIDNNGNEVLSPTYAVIFPMREGMMVAKKTGDGKYGFINCNGETVIAPQYEGARSFRNGTARVRTTEGWGLIDNTGRQLITCHWFNIISPCEKYPEYIWVQQEKGGESYCIKAETDDYAFPDSFAGVRNFNEDFTGIAIVRNVSGKLGCIDTKGQLRIPFIMEDLAELKSTYAAMLKDGKTAWDTTDEWRWTLRKKEKSVVHPISETIKDTSWDY